MAALVPPLQTTTSLTAFTVVGGFTVRVNVVGVPTHVIPPLLYVGVTVIVATSGELVLLLAVKGGMLPVPPLINPIPVFELVQA
jgi:hypothetical protein